jgi:hypothetical protein
MRELNNDNIKASSVNYHNLLIRFMQVFIGLGFLTVIYLALHTIIVEGKSLVVPTVSLGEFGLFISIFVGVFLIRTFFNIAEYKSSFIPHGSEYQMLLSKINEYSLELTEIWREIDRLEKTGHSSPKLTLRNLGYLLASIIFIALSFIIFMSNPLSGVIREVVLIKGFDFNAGFIVFVLLVTGIALGYNILLIEVIKNFRTKSRALIGLFGLFLLNFSFLILNSAFDYPYSPYGVTCMIIIGVVSSLISGSCFHSFNQSNSEKVMWLKIEANKIQTKRSRCEGNLNHNAEQKFQTH